MSLDSEIIVVSGLPRSGTSLMMQMLDRGGIPVLTDEIRTADTDNPRGYFEFERVKKTKEDASWLPESRGKAVKLISALLYDLPATETYRVIFMRRDIDEVVQSQDKMLQRLGRTPAPAEEIKASYSIHLEKLFHWIETQPQFRVLKVSYNDLLESSETSLEEVAAFLKGRPSVAGMMQAIDPKLYRNRRPPADIAPP